MHIRSPIEWLFGQSEAATEIGTAAPAEYFAAGAPAATPVLRKITTDDLRASLRLGLRDFSEARTDVAFLCLIYPILGLVIAAVDARGALLPLLFPTAAGFALIGPFAAIGLYEMSRRREITGKMNWMDVFQVIRSPSLPAIAGLGLLLIGLFLLWLVVAAGIYNITLGPLPPTSVAAFLMALFTTGAGWAMILLGIATGGGFAVAVLALSVVSFPLLLDRPVSLGTAIATSVSAVRRNPGPMALWGTLVAAGLVLGSIPFFLGLVVVLPVLGHATWHLYRKLVR